MLSVILTLVLLQSGNVIAKHTDVVEKTTKPGSSAKSIATIYYLPFLAQTYSPVDKAIIKKNKQIEVSDAITFEQIMEAIGSDGVPAKFDNRIVRLCIVDNATGKVAYVNQEGVVSRNGKEFMVRPLNLLRLNELMGRITSRR